MRPHLGNEDRKISATFHLHQRLCPPHWLRRLHRLHRHHLPQHSQDTTAFLQQQARPYPALPFACLA